MEAEDGTLAKEIYRKPLHYLDFQVRLITGLRRSHKCTWRYQFLWLNLGLIVVAK